MGWHNKPQSDALDALERVVGLVTPTGVASVKKQYEWKIREHFTVPSHPNITWSVARVLKDTLWARIPGRDQLTAFHIDDCIPLHEPSSQEIAEAAESLKVIAEELDVVYFEYRVWPTLGDADNTSANWHWDARSSDGKWEDSSPYPCSKATAESNGRYACYEAQNAIAIHEGRASAPWQRYDRND